MTRKAKAFLSFFTAAALFLSGCSNSGRDPEDASRLSAAGTVTVAAETEDAQEAPAAEVSAEEETEAAELESTDKTTSETTPKVYANIMTTVPKSITTVPSEDTTTSSVTTTTTTAPPVTTTTTTAPPITTTTTAPPVTTTTTAPPVTTTTTAAPPVTTTTTTKAPETQPPAQSGDFAEQVFVLVNQIRAEYGLPAYEKLDALTNAAVIRAKEISGHYGHTRPDGRNSYSVIYDVGLDYSATGENIAAGQRTPQEVVNAWMGSTMGHREAILSSEYRYLGVGCIYLPNDTNQGFGYYWAQEFYTPLY